MKTFKITSEITNGSKEEYHFDETVSIEEVLKKFTCLNAQQIKDAEYFFSNDDSYLYEYRYESNKPVEIFLTYEPITIITSENIDEYYSTFEYVMQVEY